MWKSGQRAKREYVGSALYLSDVLALMEKYPVEVAELSFHGGQPPTPRPRCARRTTVLLKDSDVAVFEEGCITAVEEGESLEVLKMPLLPLL